MSEFLNFSSLAEVQRDGVRKWAGETALIFEDESLTYRALDRRACKIAQGLMALGVQKNDRVGFMGRNCSQYFEILGGTAKMGAVLVGVNWRLAGPEVAYILKDSRTRVLFVSSDFYGLVERIRADVPDLETVIAIDGGHDEWPAFESWRLVQDDTDPMTPVGRDDDLIQLYTSGTTGHPKGVRLTNGNYLAAFVSGENTGFTKWEPGMSNLVCMPLFHVAGVNMGLLGLSQGCTNIILKDVDIDMIFDLIERYRVEVMFIVPAVILYINLHPDVKNRDLSSLQQILYGASPIADDVLLEARKNFANASFGQLYGMTETCGMGTLLGAEEHDPERGLLRSCGKALSGVEVRIVDHDDNEVPVGEVGEIVIRSEAVMAGYWNRQDATDEALRGGWMHTGDAGYMNEEGYVFIFDRVKDMIISGGENIYPAEVENALFAHPAIADVAVVGVPDEKWGEAVKAIVVLKAGETASEDEIRAFARERIAGYKVPKSVDFVEELPRNPSGKVLRRELRAPYWEGKDRQVG